MKKESKETEKYERIMSITLKAAVVNGKGKILLLKRLKEDLFNGGKWDLPGGHIDKGETVEEGLKREIIEETGLQVEIGPIIKVAEFEKGSRHFKSEKRGLRYIVYAQNNKVRLNKKEHDKFLWLSFDEVIDKLSKKDGFENEKRETLIEARRYLEMQRAGDNWKRSVAEFENYKKRMAKNNEEFRKYATEDLVLEILPVLDNFDAAIEHAPEDQEDNGWMTGILHIRKQLMDILGSKGVEEIAVKKGDKISEKIHEVISDVEAHGNASLQKKKGKTHGIKKVLKKGYKIADRVIRPASVEIE